MTPEEHHEVAKALARAVGSLADGLNADDVVRALCVCLSNAVCVAAEDGDHLAELMSHVTEVFARQVRMDYPVIRKMKAEGTANSMILPQARM